MKKTVSINNIKYNEDITHLMNSLQVLLEPFGGPEGIVSPGEVVLLKPNLVTDIDYTKGATTNPYLVRTLAELILEQGTDRLIIADGAAVGKDTERVFKETGYYDIFADMTADDKVEIINFKLTSFVKRRIPGGKLIKELRFPELLVSVDKIINLPVLKTHDALPVTLGLKNMKGIIHENAKKKFHRIGLSQAIVDLNKMVAPDLTVYDGTVAMEGLGPAHGEPVNLGLILAARDTVAGDMVSASIMGFEKSELDFIKLAEEQGLGIADLDKIRVAGKQIAEVKRPFARYSLDKDFYSQHGIQIKDNGGCSGCRHTLDGLMKDKDQEIIENMANKTVYLGPARKIKTEKEATILLGKCLTGHKDKGHFIEGCPPHPEDLEAFFKKNFN